MHPGAEHRSVGSGAGGGEGVVRSTMIGCVGIRGAVLSDDDDDANGAGGEADEVRFLFRVMIELMPRADTKKLLFQMI